MQIIQQQQQQKYLDNFFYACIRISFSTQNNRQPSLITSLYVQIEFVFSLQSQKMLFEIPNFKTRIWNSSGFHPRRRHFAEIKTKVFFFFFQSKGSQMAFSDFIMKKQNQSGQIWKGLNLIAVDFKIYQLILSPILSGLR